MQKWGVSNAPINSLYEHDQIIVYYDIFTSNNLCIVGMIWYIP